MDNLDHSVTEWIRRLKGGDEEAAARIWDRFFSRLCGLANHRMGVRAGAAVDEEDLALSAINALCHGARNDRFPRLENRGDLWSLLAMITIRKVINARAKEGRRDEIGESALEAELDKMAQGKPIQGLSGDDYLDVLSSTSRELLEQLDDRLRAVALLRLQGHTHQEIAMEIGRSIPTVERNLRMIRHVFEKA